MYWTSPPNPGASCISAAGTGPRPGRSWALPIAVMVRMAPRLTLVECLHLLPKAESGCVCQTQQAHHKRIAKCYARPSGHVLHARKLVDHQRRDILRSSVPISERPTQELVLSRQLARLEGLTGERNRLMAAQPSRMQGKVLGGRRW